MYTYAYNINKKYGVTYDTKTFNLKQYLYAIWDSIYICVKIKKNMEIM